MAFFSIIETMVQAYILRIKLPKQSKGLTSLARPYPISLCRTTCTSHTKRNGLVHYFPDNVKGLDILFGVDLFSLMDEAHS